MDDNRNYKSLIRSLVHLTVNHPEATTHLVTHLQQQLQRLIDTLVVAQCTIEINRLQGAIRTTKDHLELFNSPQAILHRLDKR